MFLDASNTGNESTGVGDSKMQVNGEEAVEPVTKKVLSDKQDVLSEITNLGNFCGDFFSFFTSII